MMVLLKNAKLYTMEEAGVIEAGDLLIEKGKIVGVGENLRAMEDVEVIDLEGKIVTPGLIDGHCHLGMWEDAIGFEGADGNELTDPITPHLRAIDGINPMDRTFEEARAGGVTMVATGPGSGNVIGGQFAAVKTAGRRIDDMIVKAPLAMKCAFGENPKRVYSEKKQSPSTRMAIAAEFRNQLSKALEYLDKKEKASGDPSKMPAYDMKLEALVPVVKGELPLKAHAHRADDIFTAMRIAKEYGVKMTLEHCTEGHLIAEEIAKDGFMAIVGPSFGDRSKFELKNLTFDTPGVLEKAGVKVGIMTDHPVIPIQYLSLLAAMSKKAGMSEEGALRAITLSPAEILGLDDRVGSLKVGKDADLVVWSDHPFDLHSEVEMTFVNGEKVYAK